MRCLVVTVTVLLVAAGVSGQDYESVPDTVFIEDVSKFVKDINDSVGVQLEQLKQHLETQIQLVKDQVDAVNEMVHTLKAGVDQVKQVKVQTDAVKDQVTAVNEKVDAGVDEIQELRHGVEEVQRSLIPEVRSEVVQVKDQVDALGTSVAAVLAHLSNVATIDALTSFQTEVTTVISGVTGEVVQVKGQVDDLGSTVARVLTQLHNVVTNDSLITFKAKLTTEISDLKRDTLASLQGLAQDDSLATTLEEVLATQLLELTQTITETREECGQAQSVAQLLDQATTANHRLESLGHQLNSTHYTLASSCSQGCEDVKHTLTQQTQTRCDAAAALDGDLARLQTTVDTVEGKVDQVVTYTKPPPPPPAALQTQSGSGQMNECVDSTFVGSTFNVCQAAVRYRKCRVPLLAYHCCRSCTSSGQVPEHGPWRFFTHPRTVTNSQVLSIMGK